MGVDEHLMRRGVEGGRKSEMGEKDEEGQGFRRFARPQGNDGESGGHG